MEVELKKVTIWEQYEKKSDSFSHNHIEEGWSEEESPKPKKSEFKSQTKGWLSADGWRKFHGYEKNGKVFHTLEDATKS